MLRIIVNSVLACSLLEAGLATAQTAADRPAVEKQIVANEKAIIAAILKNDPKTFHSYGVPDGGALLGDQGPMKGGADFDKIMSQMKTDCTFAKVELAESNFYWFNDMTVVHMFKENMDGTCKGQRLPAAVWSSTVWTNKGGKWLSAFHQETEAVAPPAAAKK